MKNLSVRTRILAGVVAVNVLGAMVLMVYLHQSYSRGLDTTVAHTGTQGLAAWEQLAGPAGFDPVAEPVRAAEVLEAMKAITDADYGLLVDKEVIDENAYVSARESLGEPSVWEERDSYGLLAATDEQAAEHMQFMLPPSEVPENSRIIGVEIGACSQTCHDGVTGEGDFWVVRWSRDEASKGHAVFPVYGPDDKPIGIVYAIEDISVQADAANQTLMQTLIAVGITLVVATLTIGALMDLLVLRRLARMTRHIRDISMRVAGGDFDASFEPDGTSDEIGSFEKFYADFIKLVSMTLRQISGQK
jgi:HAMP domain-containing protein